ncbi:MAG TPA: DUF3105 domain-containing protein [Roseiflexaceae bacterium]|nr:DUF3105 domain-containing protein [Roseiflexaceae bacterium]
MSKTTPTSDGNRRSDRGRSVKQDSSNTWTWIGLGGVLLAIVVVVGLLLLRPGQSGEIAGLETYANLARDHSDQVQIYQQNPPVGGAHTPEWQNCAFYDRPIRKERGVHSLEHGAVWITYRPDLAADQVTTIRNLVQARVFTMASPVDNLPSPVVASAWGLQVDLDSASDPRLEQFVSTYAQGPQTPEPGAACSGGVSLTE